MKDRLIEQIIDSDVLCDTCGENTRSYCVEAIADHLLANGVIVPPCRIGTKIYMLVTKIPKHGFPEFTFIKETKLTYLNLERVIAQFGKTVFLTHEEAEEALKKRKEKK